MTMELKRPAVLTVDLEDYRRQQLRDVFGYEVPPCPTEVEYQLRLLLDLFERCSAQATFLAVGRLAGELDRSVWNEILSRHHLGVHSHEHHYIQQLGPTRFKSDLEKARKCLEDVSGQRLRSFRAPYFSNDGCDPWFGEILAEQGFDIDSSVRLSRLDPNATTLCGSGGRVTEIALHCWGIGHKRLTIIGGTYFRILPIAAIERLIARAESLGFLPVIYLHPYDIDEGAVPLDFGDRVSLRDRLGDYMRRSGRGSVCQKLESLSRRYAFYSLETMVDQMRTNMKRVVHS